jgi:hypothetical protein
MDKNVNVVIIGLREILREIRTQLKRLNWSKEDTRRLQPQKTNPLSFFKTLNNKSNQSDDSINRF